MSIFDLPRRGQKAGRKPANGIDSKEKIAVTLDSDINDLLNKEPNKSRLINDLLRKHYKIPDVARRLKYSLELINKGRFNPLSIAKVASILGLPKAGILENYFNGVDEPDFDFLDNYSDRFGIYRDWLKFGDRQPFTTSEQHNSYASDYLQRIDEIEPEQILFIRADNEEGSTSILLKISDFKFVHMGNTWHISNKVGRTGQNQIYDLYKLIKLLNTGKREIVNSDGEEKYIKHSCGGRIIGSENFNKVFSGEIFPGSVIENHENHWWDDFTDIANTHINSEDYEAQYGKPFVEAQDIVRWINKSINKQKENDEQNL